MKCPVCKTVDPTLEKSSVLVQLPSKLWKIVAICYCGVCQNHLFDKALSSKSVGAR